MIHHRKRAILYVDDTVEQRYAMRRILETEGFSVLEAGSGRDAMELLDKSPSLAVVDVRLPDISGYDLTRQIKQRQAYLPVLQVSASFSDPDLRASGLSGGADAYIAQPVHPPELIALVKRMLLAGEAEQSLRFLAAIGPQLIASVSLPIACENIMKAMVPHFADYCSLFVKDVPGQDEPMWRNGLPEDYPCLETISERLEARTVELIDSRCILAPLFAGDQSIGSIVFFLGRDREYTASDCILAGDIANRAALVLQNCMLFSSEQATRNALIQSEKLATAGRMAAAIAHEINNPLEALTNLIYLIERSPEATDFIRDTASSALAEVTRLAHSARQTLGFYRELKTPTTINLSQSVAETIELYKRRLQRSNINVEPVLEEFVPIRGIKGEIRQVVSNLLLNALEAMEDGGKISIQTQDLGTKALLAIQDDGPGINATALARVFEPFYTTKQGTGTGLGLWITQNIVEKHEGVISVDSKTGVDNHGTRFVLEFPRAEAEVA